ncbi:MAG TPA: nucleoside transporter C-terminal domain-containing protein [Bacteriovoracaceae bacterium]|nr:nucleoside transporter C-terminal domain-containing protein [Bacteriovoracaceae bacterium]
MRGVLGILVLLGILYLFSSKKKAIPWSLVGLGLLMQIIFAVGILHVPFIAAIFDKISSFFVVILDFTRQGSGFVFGNLLDVKSIGFIFAFQILPTIIFFSALTSLFFYLGILQKIVYGLSWVMGKFLKISGAENLSTTANIFLGQTEAPLLIKPYLPNMTRSEILCVMIGGMANTAGGVLAAYVGFLGGGDPEQQLFFAKHLLAASVMSAPATIIISKMLLPQTEEIDERLELTEEKIGTNMIEAIAVGTEDGLKLAFNVAAMLIVFIAMIAMVNYILSDVVGYYSGLNSVIASITGGQYQGLTLQFILGYTCAPLVWLLGIAKVDMVHIGQLLGEKTILNEFVAYTSLGKMKESGILQDPKSIIMATYILSGFANFSSIGIQVGGIGALAPTKRGMLSELGMKALLGGTIASLLTATIVGMLT